ncbi:MULTISPECIES: hypothetical protein [Sphingomonas]|jgi:cyanate permease|uniref:hypothetical protein n=1 Tax=Sphingomonas TaxID=13687 RepID=UPI000A45B93C|nr:MULTISPECIES: hypothetical protein [Sphingomonas]WCP70749.1 hypothetical protein PPZ50_10160 [Sphingomonas hankookensis]
MTQGPAGTLLAILMLVAVLLAVFGVRMIARGERRNGWLMLVCALVMIGNVAIWTV